MSEVRIVRCQNYEQDLVDDAVRQACSPSLFPEVRGKCVLLKPNILSDAAVDHAITTNPSIVSAMIRLLKEQGAKRILVGDSPGLQAPGFSPRSSGIAQVVEKEGAEWVDFSKNAKNVKVPYTHGVHVPIASILQETDVLISLPKFKTHQLMYVTGACKNQFGLVPSLHKSACHVKCATRSSFANLIIGINTIRKPDFALMDGIIGMEGQGPANGMQRHIGLLLASDDVVALDYAEATIMGYDPLKIPIVICGLRHHLGQKPTYSLLDAQELVIKDFQKVSMEKKSHLVKNLILPFFTRPFRRRIAKATRIAPEFGQPSCILCLRCVRICPAKALTVKEKKVVIDTRKCVRCYCCHEVCPANAIVIKEKE